MNKKAWMVRAEGGELIDFFLENKLVAIGWEQIGNLSNYKSKEQLFAAIQKTWPNAVLGKQRNILSILFRFTNIINLGETVITYDPSKREYHLGEVTSDYIYDEKLNPEWPNIRKVKWNHKIDRDVLSVSTKNSLGSTLTLFRAPDNIIDEIREILSGTKKKADVEDENIELEEEDIYSDIQIRAQEFIKDKVSKLDWDEMQKLVAGLLRAMGYKTRISPKGADLGKDIVASPDGFGLEQPRIVVEVKHRNQTIGSQEIRSFAGGRHKDDKGLYVSTGGFSKDAKYEAERAQIPITLLDLDDLVKEIINHYSTMDIESKVLLPLTTIYWPK